jgi:HK97 family phage major capsid protein
MEDNRTIIEKADFALAQLAPGGLLNSAQLDRFIRLAIDKAVVMPKMSLVKMNSPKELREKIRYGSRALRKGYENTALSEAHRSRPDTDKIELDAQLVKAETRVSFEALEDSIERGNFERTVQETLAERISLDLEDLAFNGDTTSTDALLVTLNGFLKQATTNVSLGGTATLDRPICKGALKTMPSEFRQDRRSLRFYTADEAVIDYHEELGDRATPLGDEHVVGAMTRGFEGIPVEGVPVFPINLGTGTNETNMLLLDPANMLFGVWRNIRVETDKDISAGVWIMVVTARVDFKFAHEPAVVKTTGIQAV